VSYENTILGTTAEGNKIVHTRYDSDSGYAFVSNGVAYIRVDPINRVHGLVSLGATLACTHSECSGYILDQPYYSQINLSGNWVVAVVGITELTSNTHAGLTSAQAFDMSLVIEMTTIGL